MKTNLKLNNQNILLKILSNVRWVDETGSIDPFLY
jgi:hypothetical protein